MTQAREGVREGAEERRAQWTRQANGWGARDEEQQRSGVRPCQKGRKRARGEQQAETEEEEAAAVATAVTARPVGRGEQHEEGWWCKGERGQRRAPWAALKT